VQSLIYTSQIKQWKGASPILALSLKGGARCRKEKSMRRCRSDEITIC